MKATPQPAFGAGQTRQIKLLLTLVLAACAYVLGWLLGRPVSTVIRAHHPASINRTHAALVTSTQPGSPAPSAADPETEAARLADHRTALHALEARVLQLDRSGQAREAREALRDLAPLLLSLRAEDYPGAWQWFCQLQSSDCRMRAGRAIVCAWAKADPRAAIEAVWSQTNLLATLNQQVPGPDWLPPFEPADTVLSTWGEMAPQEAVAWVNQLPEDRRNRSLFSVIHGVAKTDPAFAVRLFENLPSPARSSPSLVVRGLARTDPQAAATLAETFQFTPRSKVWMGSREDEEYRASMLSDVAAQWAVQDAPGALAWAQGLTNTVHSQSALASALQSMVETGQPGAAFDFLKSRPDGALLLLHPAAEFLPRQGLARELAFSWAAHDLQGATGWLTQCTEPGPLRQAMWNGLRVKWAEQDPAGAAGFLRASFPADQVHTQLQEIAGEMAWSYAGADGLVQQTPPGPERDAVLAVLSEKWIHVCPEESARLAAAMTAGEEQSLQAGRVAAGWAEQDPAGAAAWVATFPAGEARETCLRLVVEKWADKDPVTAGGWLRTLPADSAKAKAEEALMIRSRRTEQREQGE